MNIKCTCIKVSYLEVGDTDPDNIMASFLKADEPKPTQKVHHDFWEPSEPISLVDFVDREAGTINIDANALARMSPEFRDWVNEHHSFHRIIYMDCKYETFFGSKSPDKKG